MHIQDYVDEYGEDPRDLDPDNAVCIDCGTHFHVTWLPATRVDPPAPASDYTCPACGSDNWEGD